MATCLVVLLASLTEHDIITHNEFLLSAVWLSTYRAIKVNSNVIHYINSRFNYLLTY